MRTFVFKFSSWIDVPAARIISNWPRFWLVTSSRSEIRPSAIITENRDPNQFGKTLIGLDGPETFRLKRLVRPKVDPWLDTGVSIKANNHQPILNSNQLLRHGLIRFITFSESHLSKNHFSENKNTFFPNWWTILIQEVDRRIHLLSTIIQMRKNLIEVNQLYLRRSTYSIRNTNQNWDCSIWKIKKFIQFDPRSLVQFNKTPLETFVYLWESYRLVPTCAIFQITFPKFW